MLIRKAKAQDLSALVQFNQAMAQETEGLALDETTLTRGVGTLLESPQKGFTSSPKLKVR
ncbi:hypothetical protein LFREDSHE_39510 [Shewanella baltica]